MARAEPARISVRADQVVGRVSRLLTGACIEDVNHEIYGGIYSQMIFGEGFQEPPPSPSILGFVAHGGRWAVRDGVLSIRGLDGSKLVATRAGFVDGAVGVEVLFSGREGGNAGLIARVSKPGVGADKFFGYEVALDAARQRLRLARHRNNFEPMKDVACAVAVGRWIPLEVRLAGSSIEILVDGKSAMRHDDGANSLPAGTFGLRPWHSDVSFRNLWVKTDARIERLNLEPTSEIPEISGMWRPLRRGSAEGKFALVSERPFAGDQSQGMAFDAGEGEWGIENQGLNRWGMNLVAGRAYEGYVWARAERPVELVVALENREGSRVYAEEQLPIAGNGWSRLNFVLRPKAADGRGRFALKLRRPGSVVIGHAFLQPGDWGRFKGLPVRRDVAEGLIAQGITVLRYGGSMVNSPGYRWKKMIGPRDRRPPYAGTWYRHSSNGWGILDFMDFCEAAGFKYVPAFNMGETPQDMADFVEYAKGAPGSEWGKRRLADGHRAPYRLRFLQLGNEERVDEKYAAMFEALSKAIWAKDPDIVLVVGDFAYGKRITDPSDFAGAPSGITSLEGHRRILRLAKQQGREVWFDVHVGTAGPRPTASLDGMFSFADSLAAVADGARHRVAVFEFNANNHDQKRALANALAIHAIERDGRIPIAASAICLQPDGQNDNGWNQGLLFLDPAGVWLQPPGYVTQMLSRDYLPLLVRCDVAGAANDLDANAKRSEDGRALVLQVVNSGGAAVGAEIHLAGFEPGRNEVQVNELSGPLDAVNAADRPDAIVPRRGPWSRQIGDQDAPYTFPPHSFTVMRFE